MNRFAQDMDGSMDPTDHGDWVRYEDVQELQRQLDEERARLDYLEGQAIPSNLRSTVLVIDFVFPTELPFREAIDQVRGFEAADLRIKGENA